MLTSKFRSSYQYELSRHYEDSYSGRHYFVHWDELQDLVDSATKESCSNLIFALKIDLKRVWSDIPPVSQDGSIAALEKLKDITESIDEVIKKELVMNPPYHDSPLRLPSLLKIFSLNTNDGYNLKGVKEQQVLASRILYNCITQCPEVIKAFMIRQNHSSFWDRRQSMKKVERIYDFVGDPIPHLSEIILMMDSFVLNYWRKIFEGCTFEIEDKRIEKDSFFEDYTIVSSLKDLYCCCCYCCCSKESSTNTSNFDEADEKKIDLEMLEKRLRHQPEFWHTAKSFYEKSKNKGRHQPEFWHTAKSNNRWDIFTRENLLRVRHFDYEAKSSVTEKISVFNSSNECSTEAEMLYTLLLNENKYEEMEQFEKTYRENSKPCWMWTLGQQSDLDGQPPYASKIGGAPAVHFDLARGIDFLGKEGQNDFYDSSNFLFQIDLATTPLRLQEYIGALSGLLQMYSNSTYEIRGMYKKYIPAKDFPSLVRGRDESNFPEALIVGWDEKYHFQYMYTSKYYLMYNSGSEWREKFGGYFVDVQEYGEEIVK